MGQKNTTITSYYIKKFYIDTYIYWWPQKGATVFNCIDRYRAKAQYKKEIKNGGKYQLIRIKTRDSIPELEEIIMQN